MTTTTLHYNSPVKNCRTCAHCQRAIGPLYDHCHRLGGYCTTMMCVCRTNLWQPRPPRRSLRQWIYDLLFK